MRRILQLSTLVLILTVSLAPISEIFDNWDPPGLRSDLEFHVIALVLCITLVLLVSKLVAVLEQTILLVPLPDALSPSEEETPLATAFRISYLSAGLSPPLRI